VLAVAARLARREGLPPPIPLTMRFPAAPASEESEWQERVVRAIGLSDWQRIEPAGDFDFVGPLAARCLLAHGVLWPPNAHAHAPLLECARGGSLLTGIDGDGVLGGWAWPRLASVIAGRVAPTPRDLLRLAKLVAPSSLRARVLRRRGVTASVGGWLRPAVRDAWRRAMVADEPLRWSAHIEMLARSRHFALARAGLEALAGDADTLAVHPFMDRQFLAALRSAGGAWGWGDRSETTAALFGQLLPGDTVKRGTKALFDEVFWREPSRQFAREWDGSGVDEDLVDPDALRAEWLAETPDVRTALLLQTLWLDRQQRDPARAAAPARSSSSATAVAMR
jgi:asparagine synthase (glutamine-hydrolysing)